MVIHVSGNIDLSGSPRKLKFKSAPTRCFEGEITKKKVAQRVQKIGVLIFETQRLFFSIFANSTMMDVTYKREA